MDTILLGIKDIFKNKLLCGVLILLIVLVDTIFISATSSVSQAFQDMNGQQKMVNFVDYVPVSNDMSKNAKLVTTICELLANDGSTFFLSNQFSLEKNATVVIAYGNNRLFDGREEQHEDVHVYAMDNPTPLQKIEINDLLYPVYELSSSNINLPSYLEGYRGVPILLVHVKDDELTNWVDLEDGSEIIDLLQSINSTTLNFTSVETALEGSFLKMIPYEQDTSEIDFVFMYVYPFLVFTLLAIFLAYRIIYNASLKKMNREYVLHILYGARIKDIVIRSSILLCFVWIASSLLWMYLTRFETSALVIFGNILTVIFLIILEVTMMYQIKAHNFMRNIRGG